MTKESQCAEILDYLKQGKSLTQLEAAKQFGCFRLGARIWDLKHSGHDIRSELVSYQGKHFSRYWLAEEPKETALEEAVVRNNFYQETQLNFGTALAR